MPRPKIPLYRPLLEGNELSYLTDCVKSGWVSSQGKYVIEFEKKFSKFCGSVYGIATCNGTTALHLALKTLGVSENDEVIIPALTFVATANAVSYTGAKPVFIDSERRTGNIDYKKIEEKITGKTKAIIAVHLYGCPCDIDPILKIARKYGLRVIEDAAQAFGSEYKGKKVGGLADIACFSFYANKTITTGDGGMLVTNNRGWYQRARLLRDHCSSQKRHYFHSEVGYNYKLTNMQAAIGIAQLEQVDDIFLKKRKVVSCYNRLLGSLKGITIPRVPKWAKRVCWLYSIFVEDNFRLSRDQLMAKLKNKDIETRPFFIPMHLLPMYKTTLAFPIAEGLSGKGLSLPSSVDLKKEEISYICDTIKKAGR